MLYSIIARQMFACEKPGWTWTWAGCPGLGESSLSTIVMENIPMDDFAITVSSPKRSPIAFEARQQREKTLRSFALAAVAASIGDSALSGNESPEAQFLLSYLDSIDMDRMGWAETIYEYLCSPAPYDAPLIRLIDEIGLTLIEALAIALAALVEDDVMTGR